MWHSLWRYHPRIGYTYMPSVRSRVPWEDGGYLVRTNAAGFRSEREFVKARPPNTFRAILFGDSQTAADGVSNGERYSDLLERSVPNLEVFNYALTGTGTDQQYLAYLDCVDVDHDLLIIGVFVENVGRVSHRFLKFLDANGKEVFYAKPYYEIAHGELVLQNVPVPKRPWTAETLPDAEASHVDRGAGIFPGVQAVLGQMVPLDRLRSAVEKLGLRDLMQKVTKFQTVPDYDTPDNPKWVLLRRILETWIRVSRTPVLVVPLPNWTFVEAMSDPGSYQKRFRELADATGCHVHDPLPDLVAYTAEERRAFRFPRDTHLSAKGHEALARSLVSAVERIMRESREKGASPEPRGVVKDAPAG